MLDSDGDAHAVDASCFDPARNDEIGSSSDSAVHFTENSTPASMSSSRDRYKYRMTHPHRGFALIVNNTQFRVEDEPDLPERSGTGEDVTRLTEVFSKLNFTVTECQDLPAGRLLNLLHDYANKTEYHRDADCLVIVLMSHGSKDEGLGDFIYATDRRVSIDDIAGCFKGDKCPGLLGKPKLFFVNACRGQKRDSGVGLNVPDAGPWQSEPDSEEEELVYRSIRLPVEADFLYAYSTPPGYYSFRSVDSGSVFIKELSKWLDACVTENLEISQLLKRVTQDVAVHFESHCRDKYYSEMKQCPCYMSMLTKELFFT